jgi:hypothetical protein
MGKQRLKWACAVFDGVSLWILSAGERSIMTKL